MNGRSDYDEIKAGMDAYQAFTTRTAKYRDAGIIQGMQWTSPDLMPEVRRNAIPLPAAQLMQLGYLIGKLNGEAGEVSEAFWKYIRDTPTVALYSRDGSLSLPDEMIGKLVAELGDVQWYIGQIADILGIKLGDVAIGNLEKLRSRASRGVLGGSGSDR